jgi:hypothetical protein
MRCAAGKFRSVGRRQGVESPGDSWRAQYAAYCSAPYTA